MTLEMSHKNQYELEVQVGRGRGSFQTDYTSCANCGEVVRKRNMLVKILIIHCCIIYHCNIYDLKQQ